MSEKLNAKQLRALAREARKLAFECVAGTAPELGAYYYYPRDGSPACAVGRCLLRAKLPEGHTWELPDHIVIQANDRAASQIDRRERVVFPLLALADELENAPERRPQISSPPSPIPRIE